MWLELPVNYPMRVGHSTMAVACALFVVSAATRVHSTLQNGVLVQHCGVFCVVRQWKVGVM